jgi:voltage-gated potassium channel
VIKLEGPQIGFTIGLASVFACILLSTFGFYLIEEWTVLDSFYMTVITISTVGFREVNPLSPEGRMFASFVILAGLGAAVYTTTMLGRVVLEGEFRGTWGRRRMKQKISDLRNHSVVCGYGRTGKIVAELLNEDGYPFCVVENDKDKEDELNESGYLYIIGDATEEAVLREAGVEKALGVMALLPSDADNLYLTMTAKEIGPGANVVARAFDSDAETRLKRGGADNIVSMHKIAAHRVIQGAHHPAVEEFVDLVTDRQQLSLFVEEARLHPGSDLVGKAIKDACVRTRYGVIIVTIKKASGEMIFNPDADTVLLEDDTIVAIGEKTNLNRFLDGCQPKS